jgi:DnaJ-class molecular chaperone
MAIITHTWLDPDTGKIRTLTKFEGELDVWWWCAACSGSGQIRDMDNDINSCKRCQGQGGMWS